MAWKKEYGTNVTNPVKHLENIRRWNASNPVGRARISRRYSWKARGIVGFSTDDYEAMHERQDGKCAICGVEIRLYGTARNDGDACVDHDKLTGKVRGLLCRRCNLGIGFLGDNLSGVQFAVGYLLEEYGGIQSGCL